MQPSPDTLIAILGPTASGKSAVAMDVARILASEGQGCEIVSCDSMQVYRELDIGTAKPSTSDMREIPHHLVNCVGIDDRFDTNRFVQQARTCCRDIRSRGKRPVLVGGSGLYAKAFLYGFHLQPACEATFRQICQEAQTNEGLTALTKELLAAKGTVAQQTLLNPRRLIRAVEILRLTGRPPDPDDGEVATQPATTSASACEAGRHYVLLPPKDDLRATIERRTLDMLNRGWIDEVRELTRKGLFDTPTAYQALGYTVIADWDANGNRNVAELARNVSTKTWQYARRQMTWFRHQHPGACLLTLKHGVTASQTALAIAHHFLSSSY